MSKFKSGPLGIAGRLTKAFIASSLTPLFILAALAAGLVALGALPREEEPQISVPMVDIHVMAPGLKAEDAVKLVTEPLEVIVKGINDVEHVYSSTRDDAAMVSAALAMFRNEPFFYTLNPPILGGGDPVDAFLFTTRKGFCEHYASAFTTLMRAAGIPARVVTGYQGGARNSIGGYYTVRQSDAHAWSEVWLQGKGWVRIDPTAMVAPNRIEQNLQSALGADEALPFALRRSSSRLFTQLEARWDWVNSQWNRWVLAYGPELQKDFLSRFGIEGWRDLMLSLIVALSLITSVFGLLAIRRAMPARNPDQALRQWQQAMARLARDGLIQRPHEGPQAFVDRKSTRLNSSHT